MVRAGSGYQSVRGRRLPEWREDASKLLSQFRCNLAVAPEDPAMLSLVDDLKDQSPDFRQWWSRSDLDRYGYGIGSFLDTSARRMDFRHEVLTVDEHRHLRMVIYFATVPNTD
ncbi:MmyB family transcriptional regulator [Gilvimarinus sp. DZF01]|uniref:MmyB family transcriptional regulator n=1 Tax=Gilvimarinus sp. DZF01 TaxID=3461371 RepID=UPI0040453879